MHYSATACDTTPAIAQPVGCWAVKYDSIDCEQMAPASSSSHPARYGKDQTRRVESRAPLVNNGSFFRTATRRYPLFQAMTCTSKYRYYPSPPPSISSSPDGAQAPISSHTSRVSSTAAPVSVPVQASAVVEALSGRGASGLHTPAASNNFSGRIWAVPMKYVT
jgi:hypothetical protein